MEYVLKASQREDKKASWLRKNGWVPGCISGKNIEPINIQISKKDLKWFWAHKQTKFEIEISGKKHWVAINQVDKNHFGNEWVHISFHALSVGEKTHMTVPFKWVGTAKGLKEGGIFQPQMTEITVNGLPKDLPNWIEIDISSLGKGDTWKIKDINKGYKFEFNTEDLEKNLVSCSHAKIEIIEETTITPVAEDHEIKEEIKEDKEAA